MSSHLLSDLKDGTNQSERFIPALSPDFIKMDDRDIPELLTFLSELSAQFNYYNFNNQIEGDWSGFLQSDINTLITLISKLDIKEFSKKYERLKRIIKNSFDEQEIIFYFNDLFQMVWEACQYLYKLMVKANDVRHKDILAEDFSTILNSSLVEINKLKYFNLQAQKLLGNRINIHFNLTDNIPEENQEFKTTNIFGNAIGNKEKILHAISFLDETLSEIKSKLNHLLGVSGYYLRNNNLLEQQYEPHVGLLLSFLKLYTHLQEQLNGFTEKHLNFYYKELLGLLPQSAYPDSVHLIFTSNTSAYPVHLNEGEELVAKVEEKEEDLLYKLQEELTVTNAAIAELNTIYISRNALFSGEREKAGSLHTEKVYSGSYPVAKPTSFLREDIPVKSWPILGEDQSELPQNERTMEDADLGTIVGSPILYLPEGERQVQLTFQFEEKSFLSFKRFIEQFTKESGKSKESVLAELLSGALKVDYTAVDGWQPVDDHEFRMMQEDSLQLSFILHYEDKSMDFYNPIVHGGKHKNALPLVRLLLNNNASHYPFVFFKDLRLIQVSLKAKVKGYRNIKLQNNIGILSASDPFQIFGPQPNVGSFLNIKNTNIFNKFTKDFVIRLEWMNLPGDPGGFESYYDGYDTAINNDSFRIKISALTDGRFLPEEQEQQEFQLFETSINDKGATKLEDSTTINKVNLKKLDFQNDMQLSKEENNENLFREGAVKLILSNPPEGFGDKIFPQVFPKILLHNSKRFHKPLPLPNQPLIPCVKSISIDYTLEDTVILENGLPDDNPSGTLKLIHQYPFGYEAIYPENEKNIYPFIPLFDYPNNLYIGIKNLEPGNDLSLLFKLEENNFHHTVHRRSPVLWSYLYQKEWFPLRTEDILKDTTNNFINTGIIRLKIPYAINTDNTLFNPDLYWLRASTPYETETKSKIIGIFTHGATAERVLKGSDERERDFSLPSNCIKGFRRKINDIQNTWQLFPSFGGKLKEQDNLYRARVSERLRHKQRPVTMQDIEQLILNEFPEILMAKCLRSSDEYQPVLPGVNLQIILIPKGQGHGQLISEQPKVNLATLFRVKQFLLPFLSPFINVEVGNPIYERVKIVCNVKFNPIQGSDRGFYMKQLNNDIKKYICSWLYESSSSLKIGTALYLSDMHSYLKTLPYISTATGFSMVHFFKTKDKQTGAYAAAIIDSAKDKVDFIRGSVPEAVLIPDSHHIITLQDDFKYVEPTAIGVGSLPVGDEFIVSRNRQVEDNRNKQDENTGQEEHFRLIINNH